MKFILPTVHSNGTSRSRLESDYDCVLLALKQAQTSMENAEFNGRDYYVQGAGAFSVAVNDRAKMFDKLAELIEYAQAHVDHVTTKPAAC